jgi:RNA polymerase sigma-70 factor (ECF subfamily)
MRRWQEGDAMAFEVLVRRWQAPVSRFLHRLVGAADVVQDLCQEVFLRVYLAGPRYRATAAFSTWLFQIALNLARDAARRRPGPQPLDRNDAPDPGLSVEGAFAHKELAQVLAEAQAQLPAPLREVLILRHYENMNFEDMAQLLGVPASTLKSRFAAALTRLRGHLRQLGWSPQEIV